MSENKLVLGKDYSEFETDLDLKDLGKKLNSVLRRLKHEEIPVIVQFEGFEGAGRGEAISFITHEIDRRYSHVSVMDYSKPKEGSSFIKDFYKKIPRYGELMIFDKSIYNMFFNYKYKDMDLEKELKDIKNAEKTLYDDQTIIIKIFLDLDKDEQKKRIEEFKEDEYKSIYIDKKDLRENKFYDEYKNLFEKSLNLTNFSFSEWIILDSNDIEEMGKNLILSILDRIESEEEKILHERREIVKSNYKKEDLKEISDPKDFRIDKKEYKKLLPKLQEEAGDLALKLRKENRSAVIVFEGMDAAGKGGGIKRLVKLMDPRDVKVVTTSSPSEEERARNYLWRFYKEFPKSGKISVFDRSWYGRVMVERVEHFATLDEWTRAYDEINKMEKHLINSGTIVIKYFLNISLDEQLSRFKEREEDETKNYKLTPDDWRNRTKFFEYLDAWNDMFIKTSTDYAPWTIISSDQKKYARIKILETFIERIKKEL